MKKEWFINRVNGLLSRVSLSCLGKNIDIAAHYDKVVEEALATMPSEFYFEPRIYLKCTCTVACRKTGVLEEQHGRKWYLSEHMPNDEIIKTAFAAYERFVVHEGKEGFLVDGKPLFNPHTDFEELLKICEKEVCRETQKTN